MGGYNDLSIYPSLLWTPPRYQKPLLASKWYLALRSSPHFTSLVVALQPHPVSSLPTQSRSSSLDSFSTDELLLPSPFPSPLLSPASQPVILLLALRLRPYPAPPSP